MSASNRAFVAWWWIQRRDERRAFWDDVQDDPFRLMYYAAPIYADDPEAFSELFGEPLADYLKRSENEGHADLIRAYERSNYGFSHA